MDIHKNARLTLRSREALVETVSGGLCFKRTAAVFRVTRKTAAKWVRRYQSEGAAGLLDRSSRQRRSPRATSSSLAGRVVELRREHRPAYQIAQSNGLSPATVCPAILKSFRFFAIFARFSLRPLRSGAFAFPTNLLKSL
jgi:transposase